MDLKWSITTTWWSVKNGFHAISSFILLLISTRYDIVRDSCVLCKVTDNLEESGRPISQFTLWSLDIADDRSSLLDTQPLEMIL
jgi:hypothetical protein